MNIIYDENCTSLCLIHKISKIKIYHNVNNLEIIYNFDKNEFELAKKLLSIDCSHSIFIDKFIINNFKNYNKTTNNLNYQIQNLTELDIMDLNNFIKLKFDISSENIKDSIDEYIWFIYLVRYETFEYEEDEFFLNETIKKREMCISREMLLKKINSLWNYEL